jgi:hypothetical protein
MYRARVVDDPGAHHEQAMMMLREDSQPQRWTRSVWLRLALAFVPIAVSDFSSHPAIEEASRAQRQVTDSKGRLLIPKCQLHPRGDEVLERLTDCLAPNRHPPGLDGHRSVRLVERYQAFDVACIHAFHIEALKVLGLNCGYVRHRARLPAACGPRLSNRQHRTTGREIGSSVRLIGRR